MAVDNPSYFSLSSGASSSSSSAPATSAVAFSPPSKPGLTALFRRRACKTATGEGGGNRGNGSDERSAAPRSSPSPHCNGPQGGACANQRRSFRSLFRSVSANADPERTQQFLKGDPRPSDVAPPSPYLPHRSHSHSENDKRRPGRSRGALKSASELLSNDMVYCGLARDNHGDEEEDEEEGEGGEEGEGEEDRESNEVFVGVDDARYYNLSSSIPGTGRRRHSISTFLGKERGSCSSRLENVSRKQQSSAGLAEPDAMAPPVPTVDSVDGEERRPRSCSRSRRRRHRSASSKGESRRN
ncbi:uncharacterized protein LOC102673342 isoform X2 [Apis dorsata]|nr:uncharacterized protein LOC102673342 isoform X2 [Apis dorsata]XP_031368529.1 uncharacterized protein LOC102673342 isoform X2 [Apis dorsata]